METIRAPSFSLASSPIMLIFYALTFLPYVMPQTLSPGNATDRQALLSFKSLLSSTSSSSLVVLSSWNETVDYCYWQGVDCGAQKHPGRVTNLTLTSMQLRGTLSPSLANLTFLRVLNLGDNGLYGNIPTELGQLWRLESLNLRLNSLEGEIPAALGGCASLNFLNLRGNKLHGIIPANLSSCRQLGTLYLHENELTGSIPELGSLGNLQWLNFNNNNLTGSLPPSLGNLSSLNSLEVAFNNLGGKIPAELGNIPDLSSLNLIFNQFSGVVPWNLYNFSSLYGLGLGNNLLSGTLPPDFGRNLPELTTLLMYGNNFEGSIPLTITNATGLQDFELSNNKFSGSLPPNLGSLRNLKLLRLGDNRLQAKTPGEWRFFDSLANCKELEELDLSSNLFAGPIPESIGNLSSNLKYMRLRSNSLSGTIPASFANLSGLVGLDMEKNQLSGTIPDTFGRLLQLEAFSVDSNKLFGEIPASLGNLTKMNELFLSGNSFVGSIPSSFASFQKLGMFDISYNNLTGEIPTGLLTVSSLSNFLNLSHNSFDGPLPNEVGKLINLKVLDVSWNKFSGRIPPLLGDCVVLEYLYLQGNQFNGSIPESLEDIKGIQVLDLSTNQLSGTIPKFLENMKFQFLNLSFNNLEGEVPNGGFFSNTSLFSVNGNSNLCAQNSKLDLKSCARNSRRLSSSVLATVIVLSVTFCSAVVLVCLFFLCRWYNRKSKRRQKDSKEYLAAGNGLLKVSYSDIFDATNGFSSSNVIGSGGSGTVYKAYLKNEDKLVAVKVLHSNLHGATNSFVKECEALKNLRHRNLVKILTSCVSEDFEGNKFIALIYEFMINGSLEMWLHKQSSEHNPEGLTNTDTINLDLLQRLNIVIGIASALDYLHNHSVTPIVHRDLKPSNILLKKDMTACVSDFGISKSLSPYVEAVSIGVKGSLGYIAPESGMGSPVSTSWDVYSFGVLLLEMLTGKRPTDDSFIDETNLHNYVEKNFLTQIIDILDPTLLPHATSITPRTQECILSITNIALICSNELPSERMTIGDVLIQLQDARTAFIRGI